MTAFLWHSLFRAYGWRFLFLVTLPHPLKTLGAVAAAGRLPCEGGSADVLDPMPDGGAPRRVVGAGFCLKPLACPSGRFNHDCAYLCRYSFQPFAAGMLAAGIRGRLVAFASGDCRDYRTWVRADVGIKEERWAFLTPTRWWRAAWS